MSKPNYIVLDVETTGLDWRKDQLTQVSALRVDGETFEVLEIFNRFVRLEEGLVLSDFIKDLTGLTEEFLASYGFEEGYVLSKLWEFVYNNDNGLEPVIVAHQAAFDFSFLSNYGLYPREFICTRTLARLVEPTQSDALKDVATRHGFYDEKGHHNALADIEMTRRILEKFVQIAEQRGENYRNVVIEFPNRPLTFIPAYGRVIKA